MTWRTGSARGWHIPGHRCLPGGGKRTIRLSPGPGRQTLDPTAQSVGVESGRWLPDGVHDLCLWTLLLKSRPGTALNLPFPDPSSRSTTSAGCQVRGLDSGFNSAWVPHSLHEIIQTFSRPSSGQLYVPEHGILRVKSSTSTWFSESQCPLLQSRGYNSPYNHRVVVRIRWGGRMKHLEEHLACNKCSINVTRNSMVVQWWGLHARVQSLVRELKSHQLRGLAKKKIKTKKWNKILKEECFLWGKYLNYFLTYVAFLWVSDYHFKDSLSLLLRVKCFPSAPLLIWSRKSGAWVPNLQVNMPEEILRCLKRLLEDMT